MCFVASGRRRLSSAVELVTYGYLRFSQISPNSHFATNSAVEGINIHQQLLERNVEQVAEGADARNTNSQDRAIVEQQQIVTTVQANARSLEVANERLGTVIDIKTWSSRPKST
jgi:hypothetical protein